MITDLIYAALLRCSSLTPISVWFSRSELQRTDKQHWARSKLGAGIGWRYGGLGRGIVLDPIQVSGDMEASKLLEDSLSLSACVSRGWIVPQELWPSGRWQWSWGPSVIHTHAHTPINSSLFQRAFSRIISQWAVIWQRHSKPNKRWNIKNTWEWQVITCSSDGEILKLKVTSYTKHHLTSISSPVRLLCWLIAQEN